MNPGEMAIAFVSGAIAQWLVRQARAAWRRRRAREEN